MAKKKKKRQGHYCRVCGEMKAHEKFSGKGHVKHVCKSCASLPLLRRNELQYLSRVTGISMKLFLSKEDRSLLRKYVKDDRYPELKEYAQVVLNDFDNTDNNIEDMDTSYDDTDIDILPAFFEKKKFAELDKDEKTLLKDYIRSEIIEHWEHSNICPNENELVEIRKRMIGIFEEECYASLKNDAALRKFFQDNVASAINRLQKKTGG